MSGDRGERLRAECERLQGAPVTWGVDDCSTWPAQWVATETGVALEWPDFGSEDEAKAIIADAGDLVGAWRDVARQADLVPTRDPQVGDVGIISHPKLEPFGVIFLHGGAAMWRANDGVRFVAVRHSAIVKAWEVPCL